MRKSAMIAVLISAAIMAFGSDTSATEAVLAKHRAALGTDQALAGVTTRVAEGTSKYQVLTSGAGAMDGKATIVSSGANARCIMKFKNPQYPGEDLLTNGKKVQVYGQPKRSMLGELLYIHDAMLREGIFSGVLSTAWPLLDPKLRGAKLNYNGLKQVEGAELEEMTYVPNKKSDVTMKLYFDPANGRHVMTVATLQMDERLIGGELDSTKQQIMRYRVEQRFGDFQQFDGVTLPTTWSTLLVADGHSSIQLKYSNKFDNVMHNVRLDPKNFELK